MQIRSRGKTAACRLQCTSNHSHSEQSTTIEVYRSVMMIRLPAMYTLIFWLAGTNAAGIGEAWQIKPYLMKSVHMDHAFRPRLDSSAFEIRTISGVGRLTSPEGSSSAQKHSELITPSSIEPNAFPSVEEGRRNNKRLENFPKDSFYDRDKVQVEAEEDFVPFEKMFKTKLMMRILHPDEDNDDNDEPIAKANEEIVRRNRREIENQTNMENISTAKSVRDVRLNSPEAWSTSVQPISVEFRHRIPLDQVVQQQQQQEEEENLSGAYQRRQPPRVDFVTSHYRRNYPVNRESRDMPVTRNYDDYEMPWYRNALRERDYEYPSYRRGYSYQYPDRYRIERDYYMRLPSDQYYYDRYREDDFDIYGRNRQTPKPRRIIYYATLPEIVRKPVDLRNYPRTYDAGTTRTPVTRDGTYKRIPGNVDPSKYRYRQLYDGYDPYTKRSSYYDRNYGYSEGDSRRMKVSTKEHLKNDGFGANSERKVSNLIAISDNNGKLPWPVQIGTEVSIKDDDRISGRKVFGENAGYERFQSAQLQKAPDATGSSELQSDN